MKCVVILLSAMSMGCFSAPSHPISFLPATNYATIAGYQTTIFKPIIQSLQTPFIQPAFFPPILPPTAPLLVQQPQQQPIAAVPVAQQPQPQPPVAAPPSQFNPPVTSPVAQPVNENQEIGQAPPEVASDVSDTVEIENPELRNTGNAQPYAAPPSAYPIYISNAA